MIFDWSGGLNSFYRRQIVAASLQLAADALGVELRHLVAAKRLSKVAYARQLAMYLCHVVGDMSLRDVAEEFGRDRTTVGHACHAVEERRENPILDRQVEHLERVFRMEIRRLIETSMAEPPDLETKSLRLLRFA